MKKNIFCFLLLCCTFFCIPKLVFGDIEHNIVYFVDSFNLSSSNDYITATGYSYISHQDNRGGANGNLTTSLIAYVGKWDDKYLNCDNSSNGNCFKMQNLDYSGIDHYSLRCTNYYCSLSWRNKLNQKSLSEFDEDGSQCFEPAASHCIYKDVGFKFRIDLKKLYKFFGFANKEKAEQLNFRIYSKTASRGDSIDLGVYSGVCKKDNAACGKNVSTKSFKFNIEGLANKAQMDAVNAFIQNSKGESILTSHWYPLNENDTQTYTYDVLQFGDRVYREIHYADWSLTTEGERIIQLSGYGLNGWAFSTWLKIPGDIGFKITTLTPNYVSKECSDYSNLSSNEKTKNNKVSCGSSATYKQCKKKNSVSGQIFIPTSNGECSLNGAKVKIGNQYYVVIQVKTDVLYYQEAKFTYGNASPKKVYAGKGFDFNGTVYNNTISWLNANIDSMGSPHYSYDGSLYVNSGNKCVLSDTFDITGASKYYYYDEDGSLKSGDLSTASFAVIDQAARKIVKTNNVENIKFKSCDSNNLDNCNEKKPNVSVSGGWTQQGNTVVSDYKIDGKKFGKTISNNFTYSLADSHVKVSGSGAGKAYYGKLANNKASLYQATGQKYYIEYHWTESRGKFPFNLASNINPSLLSNMEWSLNGTCKIEVENGLYRDGPGGEDDGGDIESNVVYRPIDLDEPFPNAGNNKNKIPINWRDWYCGNSSNCSGNYSNKLRLSTTYNNYPDNPLYEVNLIKVGKNGLKISKVNNYTKKSYIDTSGINLDGTSDFIIKFKQYFKSPSVSDKSFCPLGYVDTSCDVIP